jgi:uncharacterized membrane protein
MEKHLCIVLGKEEYQVTSATWRKRLSVWRNRLYLYPPPDAMPRGWTFWTATALVCVLIAIFSAYFIIYTVTRNAAYLTHGEDLGIMDQVLWNTLHGNFLHQTICNNLTDTNCISVQGFVRFAIHFEPLLIPLSLLYLVAPSPNTLLVLQVLVVASGAFPAFWLARLRLRNDFAAVAIAALYLLYPAQQNVIVDDFHAVAFTAAFLLFTLYFMYTRKTAWLFVFAILSMACKEEIPLVIIMFALWSMVFQRRWRSGAALLLLSLIWIGVYLYVTHIFSPVGQPLLASRYTYLGHGPFEIAKNILIHPRSIIKDHVLEPNHLYYLRTLLSPAGYLPILAPWVLVLAVPSLALNLLSNYPNMYSGLFQYNAEIVPVLIFSTIEAIVLIVWFMKWFFRQAQIDPSKKTDASQEAMTPAQTARARVIDHWVHIVMLALLVCYTLFMVGRADARTINIPGGTGFSWPQVTPHIELAQNFINDIPQSASVSAQSDLIPHLSERTSIYLFPYADNYAQYIFLDVTGNIYPFAAETDYITAVKTVLFSGNYGVVAAQDGYLLLERGLPGPGVSPYSLYQHSSNVVNLLPNLPPAFCSFTQVPANQVPPSGQATITSPNGASVMNLGGLDAAIPEQYSLSNGGLQVTLYWHVTAPTAVPVEMIVFVTDKNGNRHFLSNDFLLFDWCPTNTWTPGTTVEVSTSLLFINNIKHIPYGLAHVSLAFLPAAQPSDKLMDEQAWFSVNVTKSAGSLSATNGGKALQLATIQIVR